MDEDDTKYDKANPNIRNKGPNHAWNVYKETWGDSRTLEKVAKMEKERVTWTKPLAWPNVRKREET